MLVKIQTDLSQKANQFLEIYKAKKLLNDKRIALNQLLEELSEKENNNG